MIKNQARNAEILRRLADGQSFGVVADAMGLTRCLVAGVAHRAGGLDSRPPCAQRPANPPQGERHGNHKLTDREVIAIRSAREKGEKTRHLAERYAVSKETIRHIITGRRWTHLLSVRP